MEREMMFAYATNETEMVPLALIYLINVAGISRFKAKIMKRYLCPDAKLQDFRIQR
jgi:S-adenosylmethionine synthetase